MRILWWLGGVAAAATAVAIVMGEDKGSEPALPGTDDADETTGAFPYRGFWILLDNDGVGQRRWSWDVRTSLNGEPAAIAFGEGTAPDRPLAWQAASVTIDNIVR